jgi:hypothetical protein
LVELALERSFSNCEFCYLSFSLNKETASLSFTLKFSLFSNSLFCYSILLFRISIFLNCSEHWFYNCFISFMVVELSFSWLCFWVKRIWISLACSAIVIFAEFNSLFNCFDESFLILFSSLFRLSIYVYKAFIWLSLSIKADLSAFS